MNKGDMLLHEKSGVVYECLGPSRFKLNGTWIDTISYQNESGELFHRCPDDFEGFTVKQTGYHSPMFLFNTDKGPRY